ncbi:spore coat polysaccharide biosynthesis predicted glycosyltransferase SpsG [Salinibacter ruber]|uniref:glycosyltransferase n=1 Tax=Salinibacter ruber TaxID=146919 RepID=UPI00216952AB|nr:glycosyltransferase [Salinibacter ruber]MCS3632509.1 spore coat polysaccharide biosynthesis predicted glycosyltransferase SpsG [Salinibacter ruber]
MVIFRCDCNKRIGLGHVVRSIALAEEIEERGLETCFVGKIAVQWVRRYIKEIGIKYKEIERSESLVDIELLKYSDAIVVDGYHYSNQSIKNIPADKSIITYDGIDSWSPVNISLLIDPTPYKRENKVRSQILRKGLEYSPLRREIRKTKRNTQNNDILLISIGGTKKVELKKKLINAASGLNKFAKIYVAPDCDAIQNMIEKRYLPRVEVVKNPRDIYKIMSIATIAISAAGGQTIRELAYIGVPVVSVPLSDNHRLGRYLEKRDCGSCIKYKSKVTTNVIQDKLIGTLKNKSAQSKLCRDVMTPNRTIELAKEIIALCKQ